MRPIVTEPVPSTFDLLPGATFADAFSIDVADINIDAETAARLIMGATPVWIKTLLSLRNAIVRPLGLKGTDETSKLASDRIGFFPCLSRSPGRVVLGLNDKHLDFRLAVDATTINTGAKRITATTVVKPHNFFGRVYLTTIMPFHKLIVPAMLAQVWQSQK